MLRECPGNFYYIREYGIDCPGILIDKEFITGRDCEKQERHFWIDREFIANGRKKFLGRARLFLSDFFCLKHKKCSHQGQEKDNF